MPSLVTLGAASLLDDDGRPWALPYDKVRALAPLLALQPNAHPRERLADMLWPGSAGQQARANLRRALHDLRRALQAQPGAAQDLQSDKKTVRLLAAPPRWQVDALRFQQALVPLLARADRAAPDDFQPVMALYGEPFLQGLQLDDAPEFDPVGGAAARPSAGAGFAGPAALGGAARSTRRLAGGAAAAGAQPRHRTLGGAGVAPAPSAAGLQQPGGGTA